MMTFLKKLPWWVWVIAIVFIILIWQQITGYAVTRKLYGMMVTQLQEDQASALEEKDDWIEICEMEIKRLAVEKEQVQREKLVWQQKSIESATEVAKLKGENHALQIRLENVVVSNDPDAIIADLQKRFSSIRRIRP